MAQRSVHWTLQKINRISGYILFPLILIFMVSGFGMTGNYGFDRLLSAETGRQIHQTLLWPVIGLFLICFTLVVMTMATRERDAQTEQDATEVLE